MRRAPSCARRAVAALVVVLAALPGASAQDNPPPAPPLTTYDLPSAASAKIPPPQPIFPKVYAGPAPIGGFPDPTAGNAAFFMNAGGHAVDDSTRVLVGAAQAHSMDQTSMFAAMDRQPALAAIPQQRTVATVPVAQIPAYASAVTQRLATMSPAAGSSSAQTAILVAMLRELQALRQQRLVDRAVDLKLASVLATMQSSQQQSIQVAVECGAGRGGCGRRPPVSVDAVEVRPAKLVGPDPRRLPGARVLRDGSVVMDVVQVVEQGRLRGGAVAMAAPADQGEAAIASGSDAEDAEDVDEEGAEPVTVTSADA